MTDKETLKKLLLEGERINLECKAAKSEIPRDTWETYSSFANTYGGIILLGVSENMKARNREDRFEITGVKKPEQRIKELWDTLNSDKVSRNLLRDQDIQPLSIDDSSVLVVKIPEAGYKQKPVYINGNPYRGTFRRNYEGDYRCNEEDVQAMIRDASETPADSFLLEYYTMDDIDVEALEAYRREFKISNPGHLWNNVSDLEFLRNLGGYKKDRRTGKEGLTAAGLLMFGKGLSILECFPNLSVDYLNQTNLGNGKRWSDRVTIDGNWENNLYSFVRLLLPKLTQKLEKPFSMQGAFRIDESPVHVSVREALINCIIHADYQKSGKLNIIQYDNGFLFSNPGNLKLPVATIFEGGYSAARNPSIQRMFCMIGLCEEVGSGIPMILNTWRSSGWKEPELYDSLDTHTVELRLWMVPSVKEHEIELHSLFGKSYDFLTEEKKTILCTVAEEVQVSFSHLQAVLKRNPSEILEIMSELVKRDYLRADGTGRNLSWKLNQNYTVPAEPLKITLGSTSKEIMALFHASETLTNKQIVELIPSINTVQGAIFAMKKLIDLDLVVVEKKGRAKIYRRKS